MLNLLFFGFGVVAICVLILMYYSHLEHIRNKKDYKTILQTVDNIISKGCFKVTYPTVNDMFTRLSDDINYLLTFVKNKYLAIGWTNSIYFIFIMLHIVGIIFFFFAD